MLSAAGVRCYSTLTAAVPSYAAGAAVVRGARFAKPQATPVDWHDPEAGADLGTEVDRTVGDRLAVSEEQLYDCENANKDGNRDLEERRSISNNIGVLSAFFE